MRLGDPEQSGVWGCQKSWEAVWSGRAHEVPRRPWGLRAWVGLGPGASSGVDSHPAGPQAGPTGRWGELEGLWTVSALCLVLSQV